MSITANQLKNFSKEAKDIVLKAQELGAHGRMSAQGHAILRNPKNGESMSVSANSGNGRRPMHKVVKDLDRLFPDLIKTSAGVHPLGLSRLDLKGFDKDYRELLQLSTGKLGWSWVKMGDGAFHITSHDEKTTLRFEPNFKPNHDDVVALRQTILEHGKFADAIDKTPLPGVEEADWLHGPPPPEAQIQPPVPPLGVPPTVRPPGNVRRILSISPWLARRSGIKGGEGTMYESDVVSERKWSDGGVDYVCAHEGCEYDSDKPRSVAAHAHKHSRGQGTRDQRDKVAITVPDYEPTEIKRGYSPRDDRLAALTAWLLKAFEDYDKSIESHEEMIERLARAALEWQHEQRGESEPREPKTDTEILDAIRRMVDNGEYNRQSNRIDALEQELEAAREQAAACARRADSLAGNLGALRELMSDLDIGSEGIPAANGGES